MSPMGVYSGGCEPPVTKVETGQSLSKGISGLQEKQAGFRPLHYVPPIALR